MPLRQEASLDTCFSRELTCLQRARKAFPLTPSLARLWSRIAQLCFGHSDGACWFHSAHFLLFLSFQRDFWWLAMATGPAKKASPCDWVLQATILPSIAVFHPWEAFPSNTRYVLEGTCNYGLFGSESCFWRVPPQKPGSTAWVSVALDVCICDLLFYLTPSMSNWLERNLASSFNKLD